MSGSHAFSFIVRVISNGRATVIMHGREKGTESRRCEKEAGCQLQPCASKPHECKHGGKNQGGVRLPVWCSLSRHGFDACAELKHTVLFNPSMGGTYLVMLN